LVLVSFLDCFVTSFAEVGLAIILFCVIASHRVFDNSFDEIALYLMTCFELEANIEL